MPFDYNSFLQGVQTGLRLGRTTKLRPRPEPPTPEMQYILTEDGQHVLMEYVTTTEATCYNFGVWYPNESYGLLRIAKNDSTADTYHDSLYFFSDVMQSGSSVYVPRIVVYTETDTPPYEFVLQANDGEHITQLMRWVIYGSYSAAGDLLYHSDSYSSLPYPTGAVIPDLTSGELHNVMLSMNRRHMITEGEENG